MKKRIFYHDTDCGGVVYHGNYLKYFEEVRTEFLEKLGLSVKFFMEKDIYFVVRSQSAEYRRPAFYDDTLDVKTRLEECTPIKMSFVYEIHNQKGDLITTGKTLLVSIGSDMKIKPLPKDLFEKIKATVSDKF
ncbi:MAG: acyl-CoA thioesterase [Elusimicrobiales bacterium]|nr:acyl-CoA thioesterase [Elusimicrobiales bacterium]